MNNLTARVLVGLVGIPLALGLTYLGGLYFMGFLYIMASLALWEYYDLATAKKYQAHKVVGLVWNTVFFAIVAFLVHAELFDRLNWIFVLLACIMVMPLSILVRELFKDGEFALADTALTVMGLLYVTPAFLSLGLLRTMKYTVLADAQSQWQGFIVVLALFSAVWVCDSAAYFVGMKFGRHKVLPRVSPKKSWEGAIAGFLSAGFTFPLITMNFMPGTNVTHAIVIGLIVGVVGQIGDFAESQLKRNAGVKDSSTLIPGHGGVLDRFDSMIFVGTATLAYIFFVAFVQSLMRVGEDLGAL